MNQTATAPRPIVRPFIALDRVDKAREIYRLSRLGLRVKQMAINLEVDADLITTIAREEGIVLRNRRRESVIKSAGALTARHWGRSVKAANSNLAAKVQLLPPIWIGEGAPVNLLSPPSARIIVQLVALRHRMRADELTGPSRFHRVLHPRHEAIRLIYTHCLHMSSTMIAHLFNRNHTTILSSLGHTNKNRTKGKTVRPYIGRDA